MSEPSGSTEPVTVDRDGITVTKAIVLDEFPVPTVELVITSDRRESATVRLREYVPSGYSLDTIGFHAEYESDHWTAFEDNRIEFERALEPDETVRTIYGLRITDEDEFAAFMAEPEILSVSGPDEDFEADDGGESVEELVGRNRNDALRELIGEGSGTDDVDIDEPEPAETPDEPPAAEEEPVAVDVSAEEPETEPVEPPMSEVTEPAAEEPPSPATVDEPDESPEEAMDTPANAPVSGSITEQLAAELREGPVDPDDRELIQSELGLDLSRSADAQLRHLQTRVEDLFGYSDPVVDFIDDGGPERLEELEMTAIELKEAVDQLATRLDDLDSRAEAVDDLEVRIQELGAQVEAVDESVTDLVEWREQLGAMFGGSE